MRNALILCVGILLLAPVTPSGDGQARAQSRKSQKQKHAKKRKPQPVKKPVIKLQESNAATAEPPAATDGAVPQRGPTRIDFDDRLVQGQTNRAGSVYLYDRKELKTSPMVRTRESFREEIIETVYDAEPDDQDRDAP